MTTELVEAPFTRYYLRMQRGGNTIAGGDMGRLVAAYVMAHKEIKELPYILVLKPSMIDQRAPKCTSNHYIMFVSIMEKYEEAFEKELFKLSLSTGNIEIAKKDTIPYLKHKDEIDW